MNPTAAAELLGGVEELGSPHGDLLDQLVRATEWLRVPAGQRVFSEGDPADGMYLLFEGRVRFVIETNPAAQTPWEVESFAVFGEGALLTNGGRSRTAVVMRDALLARIPPELFEQVLESAPGVAAKIARRVAMRTVFPHANDRRRLVAESRIALVSPSLHESRIAPLRDAAVAALGDPDRVTVAGRCDDARPDAIPEAVRHSDRVLIVVDADSVCDLGAIVDVVRLGIDPVAAPTLELVLLHGAGAATASATATWLAGHDYTHHIHVRNGSSADLDRFARHVAGSSVGLVLGGGGARGLAHIGVIRALHELAIPIDSVGGSSMGAVLGAQVAMEWGWESMLERNERLWNARGLRWEFNVPTVSLFSGKRSARLFDEILDDFEIEDFWLPYFCTTVDLSAFQLAVHRRGRAGQWVRASATVAGLWPPVVDERGHLHIDGGQLNNLPTDQMRVRHAGPIIAVDVFSRQAEMTLHPGVTPPVGIRHLVHRRRSSRYPTIIDTLNRCALLGSLAQQEDGRRHADCYIAPDLSRIGFRGFDRIREAADIGYRTAMEVLSDWSAGPTYDHS
ncbi:MAG: cyclic nucleotide-binding and patatin-like phospholipase domain-containing protein [Ilumatobacteraceae bacterium]